MGAEVVKVERPGQGDDTRGFGPPFVKDSTGRDTCDSAYYMAVNRGKKSLSLDISKPEGQEIVRRLVANTDIVFENYKMGTLGRYGLGYQDLKAINPRLIYCSITGFGQTGPYSPRAGYDYLLQGMSGLMSVTGEREDLPGGGPQRVGIPIVDMVTGLQSTIAVLGALAYRDVSGIGQHIDMALLDSVVATMSVAYMNYMTTGTPLRCLGNVNATIVPYQVFNSKDGRLVLAIGNDGQFAKFCRIAGRDELAQDERFATGPARVLNRDILVPVMEQILLQRTSREWSEALDHEGVPCGPINDLEQVFKDVHSVQRGLFFEMPHPKAGRVPQVASPYRFSETPVAYHLPPPLVGEHTREILQGHLGLANDEIQALSDKGII
jgi:crotonobetainyl-CoA:carnitine CoA-transferase CaiB-like acyl-CoA transferase